jgi:hypothetical protein
MQQNSLKPPIDRWERCAMLIAAGERGGTALARLLENSNALATRVPEPERLLTELARLAAASPKESQRTIALQAILTQPAHQRIGLTAFFAEAAARGLSVDSTRDANWVSHSNTRGVTRSTQASRSPSGAKRSICSHSRTTRHRS